eukprot:CAMPEP_0178991536 /NCGR_PEP_ID=MMETSP0795-20121207/5585_1 /TAXON_ID=88552 /ORGANISM="Amoebophrya sp., Strain Ameob2" /LENGTH=943 /DNA_ID=CAMNT_0020683261 /DNA_START=425 /DNA_END=3256 /DNA_ORIENTATION=+
MVSMQDFERIKPGLMRAQQKVQTVGSTSQIDARTVKLLYGEESEMLHTEFLRLQKIANDLAQSQTRPGAGGGEPKEPPADYIPALERYSSKLASHIVEVSRAIETIDKFGGGAASGGGVLGGAAAAPSAGISAPPVRTPATAGGSQIGVGMPIKLPLGGGAQAGTIGGTASAGGVAQAPQPVSTSKTPGSFANSIAAQNAPIPLASSSGAADGGGGLFPKQADRIAEKPDMNMWKAQQLMGNAMPQAQANMGGGVAGGSGSPIVNMNQQMGQTQQQPSQLEFLFLDLQNAMADFEQLKPLFAHVQTAAQSSQFTYDDRRVLQGIEAEELNMRVQNIERTAQKLEREGRQLGRAEEKQFLDEVEKFLKDMRSHSKRVRELFKLALPKGMDAKIPAELPRLDPNAKVDASSPEMRRLTVVMAEVQSNMQVFEREIAPRIVGMTPTLLSEKARSTAERELLAGEASQKLHVRWMGLQARLQMDHKKKEYEAEMNAFSGDLRTHVNEALRIMKELGIEKSAGGMMGGNPNFGGAAPGGGVGGGRMSGATAGSIGADAMGRGTNGGQPQLRTVPQNSMPTPSNFAGGGGRPEDPVSKQINGLIEKVQRHMERFERDVKPLFKNVPAPQVLMNKLTDKAELKIATGQASEEIHRRYLSIEKRLSSLGQQQGPAIQAFILDLEKFEKDLAAHVPQAEEVMKRASQMSQGSTEAYKKQTPEFSQTEMEAELAKVEEDIREADGRMVTTLRNLKARMKEQVGQLADPNLVQKEVNKMAHMMSSIKNAALEVMGKIRGGYGGKIPLKQLNVWFWEDFATESQRYLATVRDLQKEEMQQARDSAGGASQDAMAQNINMPGMKLSGNILGTRGVTSENDLERSINNSAAAGGSFVQRGMVGAGANIESPLNDDATRDAAGAAAMNRAAGAAMATGPGSGFGGGMAGLAKLPKLEL